MKPSAPPQTPGEQPFTTESALTQARQLRAQGQHQQARELLENLAVSHPDFQPAIDELGHLLMQTKDFNAAIVVYRQQANRYPDDPRVHNSLGMSLIMAGLPLQALEPMQKAAMLSHKNHLFLANLAKLRMILEQWPEAVETLQETLLTCPPDTRGEINNLLDYCRSRQQPVASHF